MTKMPHWPRSISGRLVAFGLLVALAVLGASCGGDDDDNPTPTGPPVTGNEAVQASAGIASATFEAVGALLEAPWPGKTNGESGLLQLAIDKAFEAIDAKNGDGRYIAAVETCPGGGTREDTCYSAGGLTYLQIHTSNCVHFGGAYSRTDNGSLLIEAELDDACGLPLPLPDSVGTSIVYDHFSKVYRNTLTQALADSFYANFTITTDPTGPGCDGTNVIVTMSGVLSHLSPPLDEALTFEATNFTIEKSSEGSPGNPCKTTLVLNGTAHLEHDGSFSETFTDLTLTAIAPAVKGPPDSITIDGTVSTNCVGSLTFNTLEPILLLGGECPIGGLVEVTLLQGSAWIRFTATGGIEFDFDKDGTADATFATCDDHDIPHCHQPS